MIQRSGLSARSRSPMSAATSRTRSTTFLSSVSGIVKNCGAWGSMAPPTTVEFMDFSLARESIAQSAGQQVEGLSVRGSPCFTGAEEGDTLGHDFVPALPPRQSRQQYQQNTSRRPDGRGANNDCVRQLRPYACDYRRSREGVGLRGELPAALSGGDFPPRF